MNLTRDRKVKELIRVSKRVFPSKKEEEIETMRFHLGIMAILCEEVVLMEEDRDGVAETAAERRRLDRLPSTPTECGVFRLDPIAITFLSNLGFWTDGVEVAEPFRD